MVGAPLPTAISNAFAHRLAQLVPLSLDEIAVLCDLQAAPRTVQRHRDIITEGRSYGGLFIILDGNAIRYRILHDGRRQIINILIPGDLVGVLGQFMESSLYSTKALTEMSVSAVPFARLKTLFETHPRLITKILWWFSCDSAIYTEHLVDLGRRSALERVAHFLLELLVRLQAVGLAENQSYKIPLTQELIADALGLSIPHVNRVLRRLREDHMVVVEDQRVTVMDIESLTDLADFDPSYLTRFSGNELLAG